MRGRVRWYNDSKGFGFIEDEKGRDVVVYFTSLKTHGFRVLDEGAEVEFQIKETDHGLEAHEVYMVAHQGKADPDIIA